MLPSRRYLAPGAIVLLVLGLLGDRPAPAQPPNAAERKAQAALEKLRERAKGPSSEVAKVRQELIALRLTCPGTPTATRISAALGALRSPLDTLEARTIAKLEKFDWQPKELVGVLGEHRGRHGAAVSCVAISPDNTLVASGGAHLVRLWSIGTMRLQANLGHGHAVQSIAFSKNSKALVSGNSSGGVAVWDILKDAPPRLRFSISAASSPVYAVAFHPNNKVVAAGCYDNAVRLYDVGGKTAKTLLEVTNHKGPVTAVAFSPDGKTLASGSNDMSARLWDFDGKEIKEKSILEGHASALTSVAFSPSGKTLATGCGDGTIRMWGLPTGPRPKERLAHQGPKGAVTSMSFSSSGQTLAATCGDETIRLWAVAGPRLKERVKLEGHKGVVTGVAYSPNMKYLASCSSDWTVRTWDLNPKKGSKPLERFEPWSHLSAAYSVAFSPDDQTLVSGSYDRIVRFWDLNRAEPRTRNYLKFDAVVYTVAYSPDGKRVAAGGQTTTVKQWDAATGRVRPSLPAHPSHVFGLAYTPDGKHLLTGSHKELLLFDAVKGQEVRRFPAHETPLTCMATSPDGLHALSGSGAYLYKDGKIVYKAGAVVYTDCVLRRWDLESGAEVSAIKDSDVPFYSATFSADSRQLFAGPYLAMIRRWAVKDKKTEELPPWKGSAAYVHQMLASPDGKAVLTRGLDGKVIVWEKASGRRLYEWTFQENIGLMAISSDSRHLAVGLVTGVVYVMRLAPPGGGAGK